MTLQPKTLDKEGMPGKVETFDDFQLEVVEPKKQPVGSKETGGPREGPKKPAGPVR
jgi:hypothetical protein